jgi:hypothetical protein
MGNHYVLIRLKPRLGWRVLYTEPSPAHTADRLNRQALGRSRKVSRNRGKNMEWELIVHKEEKYIEIITQGVADYDGSINMAKCITDSMRDNKITKGLIDHRNITGISGKTIEIYNRPKALRLIGLLLGVKVAEVIKPEHIEHFRFLETVSRNQGFTMSLFQEKTEALKWLLK